MMFNHLFRNSPFPWKFILLSFFVVYLAEYFPLKWIFSFVCAFLISFCIVQSKFLQKTNSIKRPPRISTVTTARIFYNAYKNRKRCKTLVMDFIFGSCLWFPQEGMHTFRIGANTFLVLYNPSAVEFVLKSKTILRKGFVYDVMKKRFKEGLITSTGSKWHRRRKLMTPPFRLKILNSFFPVFNKHANVLVQRISELMEKEEVIDVAHVIGHCAMDLVTETVMGKSIAAQEFPKSELVQALEDMSAISGKRALSPWMWNDTIYQRTRDGKSEFKHMDILNRYVKDAIKERKQQYPEQLQKTSSSEDDVPANGLLDYLLDFHLMDESFTINDIQEELDTFLAAGHDSMTSAIGWMLYMIGLHEDVQRNVHEEIDTVIGEENHGIITVEDVKKLQYLNCVLKETLRLYPPVSLITRRVEQDTNINEYKITKDTTIVIPIYMLHRNPEIFPNPDVFQPERFNELNSNKRHGYVYIPFSAGPRRCIGETSAIYQIITVVASVLRHFRVTSTEQRDKVKLSFEIVLKSQNGFRLKFTKRKYQE